jgi:hypothetical protein
MLFVLSDQGVPSVAKFIRLKLGRMAVPADPPPPEPPDTVITSGPPSQTQSTSASFEFHATQPDTTFECRLDGEAVPCSSPWSYSSLPEGPHVFEVIAVHPTAGPDPTPAAWPWTIEAPDPPGDPPLQNPPADPGDTTTPDAPIPSPPALQPGAAAALAAPHVQIDSSPPILTLVGNAIRRRRVIVKLACPVEACGATASGRLWVGGRAFGLRPGSTHVEVGQQASLAMQLSRRAWDRVRRTLRAHRAVRASITLTVVDRAGNAATARRTLRLTGGPF